MLENRINSSWPQQLEAYDYLRTASMSDWAWEFLRRNADYRAAARLQYGRGVSRIRLQSGTMLTRMSARHVDAEAWGLCCFR
jgi:Family of unknown function (DUF6499)